LNHLAKGSVFEKAKTLRDRFHLSREDGTSFYVRFFNSEEWTKNLFQVTNQITQEGTFKNRYDVTLLVNGLPLVQIELKRSGMEIKEAFNQINRYQRHSFWSNHGFFQYVQLFVISNGVNTKYLANNKLQSVKQTFFWADDNNNNITDLTAFASGFLHPNHLGKMIAHYIVINETLKNLMILRPYQYYATEAIINQVDTSNENGYIWHTTGSGKTLTSFKASQMFG
jgi:type I restriction enzyme R subunit